MTPGEDRSDLSELSDELSGEGVGEGADEAGGGGAGSETEEGLLVVVGAVGSESEGFAELSGLSDGAGDSVELDGAAGGSLSSGDSLGSGLGVVLGEGSREGISIGAGRTGSRTAGRSGCSMGCSTGDGSTFKGPDFGGLSTSPRAAAITPPITPAPRNTFTSPADCCGTTEIGRAE